MDYETEREKARAQLVQTRSEAATAADRLFAATGEVVAKAYQAQVPKIVLEHSETTTSNGENNIKLLKHKLGQLVARAPDVARRELDRLIIWVYREDPLETPSPSITSARTFHRQPRPASATDTRSLSYILAGTLADSMNDAEKLLREFGYAPSSRARLLTAPAVSEAMNVAFMEYSTALDAMYTAHEQIQKIDKAESLDKAQALWDQA
jgi:hypothetical protein